METQIKEPRVKFKVSLSNGETLYEGKGNFQRLAGLEAPYARLLSYISENNLNITSFALYTDTGKVFNLPSLGNNPKFKEFQEIKKPLSYNLFRKLGKNIEANSTEDLLVCAEAYYSGIRLQLWVDDNNPDNSWVLIKEV